MKKIYLLFVLCGCLFAGKSSGAAVPPGITINYAADSTFQYCAFPDTRDVMISGTAGGYLITDSVNIYINFGDGTDTTFMSPIGQEYFWAYFQKTWTTPGVFSMEFIVTGPDGDDDTLINSNTVVVASQCGNISGTVYQDGNADCIYNTGDVALPYQRVDLLFGGAVAASAWTDANGEYFFSVPVGNTFTIAVVPYNPGLSTACPVGGTYTVSTLPSTGNDFAVECSQSGYDLNGYLSVWGLRPGMPGYLYAGFGNTNCTAVNGTVTITLPTGVTYVNSTPAATTVNGNVLTYDANPFTFWSNGYYGVHIEFLGDLNINLGDTLCFNMMIDPVAGDLNPADNAVMSCVAVRNSWDPNDKFEKSAQLGPGNIAPNQMLDYTINFQNLGNDDALKVVVLDTLSSYLDLTSLNIISASHPYNVYLVDNSILKFEFLNINLPAASVNEPMSHGFVHYTINPVVGLTDGTSIYNTAYIYFDFNSAVVTNTTENVIDIATGIHEVTANSVISVYPNPAKDKAFIRLKDAEVCQLMISDIAGKVVFSEMVNNNSEIDLSTYNSGTYILKAVTEKSAVTLKLIVE